MWKAQWCLLLLNCACFAASLRCFNCSATNKDWNYCGGEFGTSSPMPFNDTKMRLVNCTEDNAMCFVRSWSARGKHAWLVQRGCYHLSRDDPLPHSGLIPTRAMACKHERLRDAEYKVCLCQADWCNAAVPHRCHSTAHLVRALTSLVAFISGTNLYML